MTKPTITEQSSQDLEDYGYPGVSKMSRLFLSLFCSLSILGTASGLYAAEAVAYRLPDWHEQHFEVAEKAELHFQAVKKLKCEARKVADDDHLDVEYRVAKWQYIEVATDELAHQWSGWLKASGFEVLHGHGDDHEDGHNHGAEGDGHKHDHAGHDHAEGEVEEVTYRLTTWKTVHLENKSDYQEFIALMKGFGCELQMTQHEGHGDVKVRCPTWRHIEFPSHKVAEAWEGWLTKNNFEVEHSH
tara:strand:+ start:335 stop:1066 length:732 start_codon:yes stop_codon:yes gene_type:complete